MALVWFELERGQGQNSYLLHLQQLIPQWLLWLYWPELKPSVKESLT